MTLDFTMRPDSIRYVGLSSSDKLLHNFNPAHLDPVRLHLLIRHEFAS